MTRPAVRDITASLAFDGTTRFGKATAVPFASATQVTICGWVKLAPSPTFCVLMESSANYGVNNAFGIFQNAANSAVTPLTLALYVSDVTHAQVSSIITLTGVPANTWVRFCAVIDQTVGTAQANLYINGVAATNRANNGNCTAGIATADTYFGDRAGTSNPLNGSNLIVNRIYTGKAFTAAEALSEYLTGNYPAGGTVLANYDWTPNNALGTITDTGTGAKNIVVTSPLWSLDTPMQARPVTQDIQYSLIAAGSGDVSVPNAASLNVSAVTLRAWIKMESIPTNYAAIIGKVTDVGWADGYMLGWRGNAVSGSLSMWVNNYSSGGIAALGATDARLPIGRWALIHGTYDGATVKLYVDGRLVNRQPYATPINNSAGALRIGSSPGPVYPWLQRLADPLIANVAWTDAQIRQDFLQNVQPVAGRVSRWPLDDPYTSGGVARDVWGANPGTYAAGVTLTNDTPSHARMGDIDLGIAGQELLVRADDPGIVLIGGAVASWPDYRRYQNRALTQDTSTKRPVMTRGANGRPGVLFDGVDDYLQSLSTLVQPSTVLIVFKSVTLGAISVHDAVFSGGSGAAGFYNTNAPLTLVNAGNSIISPTPVANGSFAYAVVTFNGASSSLRANGVDLVSGNASTTNPGGLTLAGSPTGTRTTNILVMEARVLSTVPTAAEIARWESYCKKVYGL